MTFRNLEVDSRLEMFKGKPKGFEVPSHAVFTHQSEYGLVIFEVETRVTSRYIPPGAECLELAIERTGYLNYITDNSDPESIRFASSLIYSAFQQRKGGKINIGHLQYY